MLKSQQTKKNAVVFSQWSRKGYAVFSSLKRVVMIAHLSIDLCDFALLKSFSSVQIVSLFCLDELEDKGEEVDLWGKEFSDNPIYIAATLPVLCGSSDFYFQNRINIDICEKPIFCLEQNIGFLFF